MRRGNRLKTDFERKVSRNKRSLEVTETSLPQGISSQGMLKVCKGITKGMTIEEKSLFLKKNPEFSRKIDRAILLLLRKGKNRVQIAEMAGLHPDTIKVRLIKINKKAKKLEEFERSFRH